MQIFGLVVIWRFERVLTACPKRAAHATCSAASPSATAQN